MICRHHLASVNASACRAADHLDHVTAAVQLPQFLEEYEGFTT